jgi:hypothetical protein
VLTRCAGEHSIFRVEMRTTISTAQRYYRLAPGNKIIIHYWVECAQLFVPQSSVPGGGRREFTQNS